MATPPVLNYCTIPQPPWLARWLMRPLGWPFFVLAAAACLWAFWECRVGTHAWTKAAIPFLPLAVIWIFRAGIRAMLFAIYHQSWIEHWQKSVTFGIAFWIPALMAILIFTRVPERLAFRISESALESMAASTLATGIPPGSPTTVGCLPIDDIGISADGKTVHFLIESGSRWPLLGPGWGYVYTTDPPTEMKRAFYGHYEHIRGNWYRIRPIHWSKF